MNLIFSSLEATVRHQVLLSSSGLLCCQSLVSPPANSAHSFTQTAAAPAVEERNRGHYFKDNSKSMEKTHLCNPKEAYLPRASNIHQEAGCSNPLKDWTDYLWCSSMCPTFKISAYVYKKNFVSWLPLCISKQPHTPCQKLTQQANPKTPQNYRGSSRYWSKTPLPHINYSFVKF